MLGILYYKRVTLLRCPPQPCVRAYDREATLHARNLRGATGGGQKLTINQKKENLLSDRSANSTWRAPGATGEGQELNINQKKKIFCPTEVHTQTHTHAHTHTHTHSHAHTHTCTRAWKRRYTPVE